MSYVSHTSNAKRDLLMIVKLDYSAFDPIFWLHHTNIDRLFSIWQAIYPDRYETSKALLTKILLTNQV